MSLRFKDLADETSRQKWWEKELKDAAWTYRIPGYNLPGAYTNTWFNRRPVNCIDVGVNVGAFCAYASPFFTNIYGFECAKQTFETAQENLSPYSNVAIHNLAVGDSSDREITFYAHKNGLSRDTSCYTVNNDRNTAESETATTIALEDIYIRHNIDYIDYLKVWVI